MGREERQEWERRGNGGSKRRGGERRVNKEGWIERERRGRKGKEREHKQEGIDGNKVETGREGKEKTLVEGMRDAGRRRKR